MKVLYPEPFSAGSHCAGLLEQRTWGFEEVGRESLPTLTMILPPGERKFLCLNIPQQLNDF